MFSETFYNLLSFKYASKRIKKKKNANWAVFFWGPTFPFNLHPLFKNFIKDFQVNFIKDFEVNFIKDFQANFIKDFQVNFIKGFQVNFIKDFLRNFEKDFQRFEWSIRFPSLILWAKTKSCIPTVYQKPQKSSFMGGKWNWRVNFFQKKIIQT